MKNDERKYISVFQQTLKNQSSSLLSNATIPRGETA